MALMDVLRRIASQYGEGMMMQKYGPDWRQKRDLMEAQTANTQAETERIGATTSRERSATAHQDFELEQARQEVETARHLFEAGKIDAPTLKAAEYLLRQKEANAQISAHEAATKASSAQEAYTRSRTLTPEQLAQQLADEHRVRGAQAGYYGALGRYNESRQPAGSVFTHHYTPQQMADIEQQARRNLAKRRPGAGARLLNWGMGLTGETKPLPQYPEEGTPEYNKELMDEITRLKQGSMVQIARDPKTGKMFWALPGGTMAPATPDVASQYVQTGQVPGSVVGPPAALPDNVEYDNERF